MHFLRQLLGLTPPEDEQRSLLIAFWRSTVGVFVALRLADVLNAITGLWVIPSKLPQETLGAVLPLLQAGAVLAIPISIFAMVFTRHLCAYAVAGDTVRTRGLLRDAVVGMCIVFLLAFAITSAILPWLCAVLRIPLSAAGYWTIAYGLLAAFTPMAWSALQALRKFGAISGGALLAAPIRLAAMFLLLPTLGLSGYFIGQSLPLLIILSVSLWALRPLLKGSHTAPFFAWRNELKSMASYAGFIALGALAAALQGAVITFVIRNRLTDDTSGAYYLISRFAEIATYCGTTFATVLFPFALEARLKGYSSRAFRSGVIGFVLLTGGLLAIVLYWILPWFFTLLPTFESYSGYAPQAAYLTVITTLNAASTLHFTHAAADDRFSYLWFTLPCALLLSVGLLFLPNPTLQTILHLLCGAAVFQFIGCLWHGAICGSPRPAMSSEP
ncbi:MAG: hypothetical protein IJV69_05020 [Kiritimatiellae bacterium]|nr:hypothetical protein [Kiritimatiellia bacterium]